MPLNGNRIGPRLKYFYQSDDESVYYILRTDADLAVAGLGDAADAPIVYDVNNPPPGLATVCPAPKRFKPRVVHVQDEAGNRKSLIAFSLAANAYTRSTSQEITIDGRVFTSTGRRGEQLTF